MCKFHASTIFHWCFFLPKCSLPEYCLPFAIESLPMCFTCITWFIYIINMVFNVYLNKNSWNTHVLIYIMCKFHASTIYQWFLFSPESQPSKILMVAQVCPFKRLPTWRCFTVVLWFILVIYMVFNMYLSKHSGNTHFLFTQHSTKLAAPRLAIALSQP